MSIVLGIDTGGTYTDAVLINETDGSLIAKAKALTTHHQLEFGISKAISKIVAQVDSPKINLVSVSTTLATNAVVEGVKKKICAILIGLEQISPITSKLLPELKEDDVLFLAGGHNAQGEILQTLDLGSLESYLANQGQLADAFAVASYFSVRNPEHELAVKNFILSKTRQAVSCSHELASDLDAPRRALTTILNARLVGLLTSFITAVETSLTNSSIHAPLMIVKGDGSLISSAEAKFRPIETIYSGPAASLVGASYLSKLKNAIIADIGGTTTDIAILKDGLPKLNNSGVKAGKWRTMVKGVDMQTFGLGGDSELSLDADSFEPKLKLGPRRALPISLLAMSDPEIVHETLELQLNDNVSDDFKGRFLKPLVEPSDSLTEAENILLESLDGKAKPLSKAISRRRDLILINKMIARKYLALSSLTPSDAAHVLSFHNAWDKEAALKATSLFAKKRGKNELYISNDAQSLAKWILDSVVKASAHLILDVCLEADGLTKTSSQNELLQATLAKQSGLVKLALTLDDPIIGLGASAHLYYPQVGDYLKSKSIIPEHAEVANAVGAVMGLVRSSQSILVTEVSKGIYRVHHPISHKDFTNLDKALLTAEQDAIALATEQAKNAGSKEVEVKLERVEKRPVIDGEPLFLESLITATAFGRPSF